ncbi:MAG: ATP-binding protein [Trebonia sp.]
MAARASVMVGRDGELRLIQSALSAAREGRGGAVFVIGEMGIGKSRLATAAAETAVAAGMTIMRGRGSSISPMVPFRPLAEAIMSLLRSRPAIDPTALGPYRPVLARLVPDWGAPPADEGIGSLMALAEGVLRLTALAGAERGCLLILDDLQDSDAETLAVAEYLTDNVIAQPVVLLGTVRARPSPALNLAKSVTRRGSGVSLTLRRLAEPETHQMLCSCLGTPSLEVPGQLSEYVWAGSAGIPLLAEELIEEALTSGMVSPEPTGWRVRDNLRHLMSATVTRTISSRMDLIGPDARELLSLAAMLGQRFPVSLLRTASRTGHRELLSQLHSDPIGQFVAPDGETPGWYSFRHSLIADALVSLLAPERRAALAARAAQAVQETYPGLPGEWCQAAAALLLRAGDPARAGSLFAEAGHRALHQGAATSAVALLDKALKLLPADGDAQVRADAVAALLDALVEAGQVDRAISAAGELSRAIATLDEPSRARVHTKIAWAAMVGGRPAEGLAQVEIARRLLGPNAPGRHTAPVDIVEAHLTLDDSSPGRAEVAERLARRAATTAEAAQLPEVACQAWQLLGTLTRLRDPAEATACLEQARRLAMRHRLPIEEIHALFRLGNDDALRDGSTDRLEQARELAIQAGAVTTRYQAEASIAFQAILRADFAAAEDQLGRVLTIATRSKLLKTAQYALLLRAIAAAHRARRRDMDAAFAELRSWEGARAQHQQRAHGLARAWCALLEENRPRAQRELSLALAEKQRTSMIFQMTGPYGLGLLMRVLDGQAGIAEYESITAEPASQLRWNRQLALFAHAVIAGRAGRSEAAERSMAEALQLGTLYPTARNLGLRLVAEAAITDGWGKPSEWLRTAEEYFHQAEVPAVAGACRAMLRQIGIHVAQRRRGAPVIPDRLRAANVTTREYETLCLLANRLSNREIAARLHVSPRTTEKHVASLLAKTGLPDRIALADLAVTILPRD